MEAKLTIAIPTYKRPTELQLFVEKHYGDLAARNVHLAIFHNEKHPEYIPEEKTHLKNYFNDKNIGINSNMHKICRHFLDPSEYWLPLPDQDTINFNAIDILKKIIAQQRFDCLQFDKGDSMDISKLRVSYECNYLKWLQQSPVSEVQFVYRGGLNTFFSKAQCTHKQGSSMSTALPTHTLCLMKACQGKFVGVNTNLQVVHVDALGSVTSEWPIWIPNIITCHVIFIKFQIYAAISTSIYLPPKNQEIIQNLISGFLPGLANHMLMSVDKKMYCGKRLGKIATKILKQNKSLFSGLNLADIEEFAEINNTSLVDLPLAWQENYHKMKRYRQRFAETYPEWIFDDSE